MASGGSGGKGGGIYRWIGGQVLVHLDVIVSLPFFFYVLFLLR